MIPRSITPLFRGLSKNALLITVGGLFADMSTEMLVPVLPLFLTQTLNANGSVVGLVDGIAQAVRNLIDGLSGSISDKLRKRKAIVLVGYALGVLAKPLMGASTIWESVLAARLLDRLGAGIRSAPRDALVASSVDKHDKGRGFGLEGLGENTGAFLGPILTLFVLYGLHTDLRSIFYVALVPGLLALAVAVMIREQPPPAVAETRKASLHPRGLSAAYWKFLAATAIFSVGNSTNSFLILRTQEMGASPVTISLVYAAFNLVAALVCYPLGSLSDAWGRKFILLASYVVFLFVYLGFFFMEALTAIIALFILYGIYQGAFRSVGKTLASDFVPDHLRASGIGWYSATAGLLQLVASLIAGLLWDNVSHTSVFLYGVVSSAAGIAALVLLVRGRG